MCESGTGSVLFVLFYLSHQGKCVWQWYKSMGGRRVDSVGGGLAPVHRYQQGPRGQRRQLEVTDLAYVKKILRLQI